VILRVHVQVIKSESGQVLKTFPSHSKAVLSLVCRSKCTATTGEDFEVHLYQTFDLMTSCEGFVCVMLLGCVLEINYRYFEINYRYFVLKSSLPDDMIHFCNLCFVQLL